MLRFSLICIIVSHFYSPLTSSTQTAANIKSFNQPFIDVSERSLPASVGVEVIQKKNSLFAQPTDPFEQFFFGTPEGRQEQRSRGSGFFISSDGLVMTNHHVVKGGDIFFITLHDKSRKEAKLIAGDEYTDVALLKVEGKGYPFLELGESDDLSIGEWVIAIGSPFELDSTVTAGIVSAIGRNDVNITSLENFIQTTAAINRGNSGGPLVNLEGKVVGMNTAIYSQSGDNNGIGFAIPASILSNVKTQIVAKGKVSRGYLGITLQIPDEKLSKAFTEKNKGSNIKIDHTHVIISEVETGSPANNSGIMAGDVILKLNKIPLQGMNPFRNNIMMLAPGDEVDLTILREGKIKNIKLKVGSREALQKSLASGLMQNLGILGIEAVKDNASKEEGVRITKTEPQSLAEEIGLTKNTLILQIGNTVIRDEKSLSNKLEELRGKHVIMLIKKHNRAKFLSFQLPE